MRVGLVTPYDLGEPGGVQQIVIELGEHLLGSGDDVVVVGPGKYHRHGGPGHSPEILPIGRSFKIPANQSNVPLTLSPLSFRRMHKALEGVDVIHIHEPLVPLAGWAAFLSSKPKVMTFHADTPDWVESAYRKAPFLGNRMRSSILTAVSESARASLPAGWGEVRIIPNAIDVDAYNLPVGRVDRRIAFLGRDDPRKGLDIALEAFASVHERHPGAELIVMGADRQVAIPGVRFMGRVSGAEKNRMLASSAIYIAPNTGGESFGIVLAEAMAAGCAVVASDLDSFRAVLGDAGVLFPTGDAGALADIVSNLLESKAEREPLSVRARAEVRRFDWSVVVEKYRDAYAQALVSS